MLRNLMLGSASFLPLFDKEAGGGAGGGDGADTGAAGAAAAAAGSAGGAGAGGAAAGAGGAAGGGDGAGGAAAAGASAGATLADGGTGGAAAAGAAAALKPGELPAGFDFRAYLAGGDADKVKDLAKYTDPKAIYDALRGLQTKVSKGELKAPATPFPEKGSDAEKAAWRTAQGVPATAEDYVKGLALPDGVVIGEADKALVSDFATTMHAQGATQGEMNRAVSWFYAAQEKAEQQRTEADGGFRVASEVALRGEWGADFGANMNAFGVFKAQMPAELQASIFAARTPDGRMLGDTPEFLKAGAAIGRLLNPAATLIVPGGGDVSKTIGDEIASIEKSMYDSNGNASREYWGDEKKQARYRELITMRDQMAAKGKAA